MSGCGFFITPVFQIGEIAGRVRNGAGSLALRAEISQSRIKSVTILFQIGEYPTCPPVVMRNRASGSARDR
jgi:hypothetical protein